jgi:hypothetical protein
MPLNFYLLDIDSVSVESNHHRSDYDENILMDIAKSLIANDDLIKPILVRQVSPIRYQVIEGHREYFAAVKAREISPDFDEIRAVVVSKDLQDSVLEQYRLLFPEADPDQDAHLTKDDLREVEQRLRQNFQVKFDYLNDLLSQQQNQIHNSINALMNKLQDLLEYIKPKDKKLSISEINTLDLEALKARMQELSPQDFLDDETKEHFLKFIQENRSFVNFDALYHKIKSVKNPKSSRKSLITKSNLKKIVRD